jgi:hypothetical protein
MGAIVGPDAGRAAIAGTLMACYVGPPLRVDPTVLDWITDVVGRLTNPFVTAVGVEVWHYSPLTFRQRPYWVEAVAGLILISFAAATT